MHNNDITILTCLCVGDVKSVMICGGKVRCLKWMDKRQVNMLSKFHNADMIEKERRLRGTESGLEKIKKPKMVEDYNMHMGGVDKNDQAVMYYGYPHRLEHNYYLLGSIIYFPRAKKWWKRVFFHLLDVSIANANVLYNMQADKPLHQLHFRLSIIKSLLEGHTPRADHCHQAPQRELPTRLTERPFLERVPSTTVAGGRPVCEVCRARGKRSQTRFRCKVCKTPLHMEVCFEVYHTKQHYEHE